MTVPVAGSSVFPTLPLGDKASANRPSKSSRSSKTKTGWGKHRPLRPRRHHYAAVVLSSVPTPAPTHGPWPKSSEGPRALTPHVGPCFSHLSIRVRGYEKRKEKKQHTNQPTPCSPSPSPP